jgi:hypothetical protein
MFREKYINEFNYKQTHMNNTQKILITALILSTLFDTITFLAGHIQFETNPIYLLTGSTAILLILKFSVIAGLTYLLIKYKPQPKKYTWSYTLIFMTLILILTQTLAAISNINVTQQHDTDPVNVQPYEKTEAIKTYMMLELILVYLPLFVSVLSFWTWQRIYLNKK